MTGSAMDILDIVKKRLFQDKGGALTGKEALEAVTIGSDRLFDLIALSDRSRRENKGDRVFTCAIVNAKSGYCSQNCAYCAQSSYHKTNIETYPLLSERELISRALQMQKAGATQYSMVTSGHSLKTSEIDRICRAAEKIKAETDLNVCASLGMVGGETARGLMQAGITRYHHNLETAESYFDQICTTHEYAEDIETIRNVRAAGMKVCSGGIMGLGESWEQRIELALTLRELEVDSIPLNFLNPIPGTRLENRPVMAPMEALRCIVLFRILHPKRDITICGGREITLGDFQALLFPAGSNGVMIGNYLTTGGRDTNADLEMIAAHNFKRHGI